MPRLTAIHWKVLACIFEKAGFTLSKNQGKGSHTVYHRKDCLRPVIIPRYKEIDKDIILNNMRTAEMSREEYFKYLNMCK